MKLPAGLIAILVASTLAVPVYAQSQARPRPKDAKPIEDVLPPPQVQETKETKIADARDLKVTTRVSGTDTIEEYRLGGKLYKQRIQPANGPAYILIDEKGEGKFVRVDGPDAKISVPMWVLFTW
ncbi:MAG: DUF2782 domain-containing protein [Usitatibacteraceae bacterium]